MAWNNAADGPVGLKVPELSGTCANFMDAGTRYMRFASVVREALTSRDMAEADQCPPIVDPDCVSDTVRCGPLNIHSQSANAVLTLAHARVKPDCVEHTLDDRRVIADSKTPVAAGGTGP
jgi:hypothetical protein